jgi:decaprenyl-phosphate phosphoribosyltransferase
MVPDNRSPRKRDRRADRSILERAMLGFRHFRPGLVDRSPGRPVNRRSQLVALLVALRPDQWTKNVLVVAAPVAAGVIFAPPALLRTFAAFVAFCLAASGGYLVNDAVDVEADRAHPLKRTRPIAAGELAEGTAGIAASVLLVAALAVALAVSTQLCLVVFAYELLQLAYCFGLKREPVVELGVVSSGFVLRAIAGGVADHLPLSHWFLMAGGFGSLFMVAGKRYAEVLLVERTGVPIRRVLSRYTASYLRFIWTVAAGMLVMTYSLWAFAAHRNDRTPWTLVSVVPFVFGVLRYALDIDGGNAGAPEKVAVGDRVLLVIAGLWAVSFLISVYA